MKKITNIIIALSVGILGSEAPAAQPTGVTIQGEATTSSLPTTPETSAKTLGSANLRLKIAQGPELKLQCGILGVGELQGKDQVSLQYKFQHTVTCDDRSIFILNTNTVISPTGVCTNGGFVGTFHEESALFGVAGPYSGAQGQATINGTIDCGFNKMTIQGSFPKPN